MKSLIAVLLLSVLTAQAQDTDISKKLAFASLTTVQEVRTGGLHGVFAPNIILRFTKQGTSYSFLAMTDAYGTASIPIEVGVYCAEAYRLNGKRLKLTKWSNQPIHRCFTAVAGEDLEFSLTIDADEKGVKTLPSGSTMNHEARHADPPKPQ